MQGKIKAMDVGTKLLQFLRNHISNSGLTEEIKNPSPIYNDNQGAVYWSKASVMSKKTRHMNLHELAVTNAQEKCKIDPIHIPGKLNPSDLFTKEHKDVGHYWTLQDLFVIPRQKVVTKK